MAYYDALIAAWNAGTVPNGATGSAFVGGDTTAQKLVKLNAWAVTGSVPTSFFTTGGDLLNAINYPEYKALTSDQRLQLLGMLQVSGQLLGGSGNTAHMVAGMIIDFFLASGPLTIAALTVLAKATVTPWVMIQVAQGGAGLSGLVGPTDLVNAGGLT